MNKHLMALPGGLVLQAWAPPSHPGLAPAWLDQIIAAFIGAQQAVVLLGHRPGRWRALPPQLVPGDTQALLASLTEVPGHPALHRIPPAVARASVALLHRGDIHVRQQTLDEATGLSRIVSTHLGRVLVLSSTATLLQIVQQVLVPPPLQLSLSWLKNPTAGLRQPDAAWLRSIRDEAGDTLVVGWLGHSLQLLAGRETLLGLHHQLSERLAAA